MKEHSRAYQIAETNNNTIEGYIKSSRQLQGEDAKAHIVRGWKKETAI
jgi:hypothetical protein